MVKQTPKMSNLIVSAIRNLREIQGSSSKEIINYIKNTYEIKEPGMQKQLHIALKRGLGYGILKRADGNYCLNIQPDVLYDSLTEPTEKIAKKKIRRRGRDRRKSKISPRTAKRKRSEKKRPKSKINRKAKRFERPICNCDSVLKDSLGQCSQAEKNNNEENLEENGSERSKSRERSSSVSRSSGSSDLENPDDGPNRQNDP